VVYFEHPYGCAQIGEDAELTRNILVRFGTHPNVYGVIVVGLGCETIRAQEVADEIKEKCPYKPVQHLLIQDEGGVSLTVAAGSRMAMEMLAQASMVTREPVNASELILGTMCGGSDSYSGISANPSLGVASDMLVDAGGTVILAETTEIIGAEHVVAARAVNAEVSRKCLDTVRNYEAKVNKAGVDMRGGNPTPGNIEGGLTTIEEKSLGCIYKCGSSPLQDVIGYAEPIVKKGLIYMDTPGFDVEQITGMAAGGCQIVVFTTGRGTPTGSPIAPTIKVSSNTKVFKHMREDIDLDAGTVITGEETVKQVGQRIFDEMLKVASGQTTQAEMLGCNEFGIPRLGPSV
jgi:altronate dehydratase large subunit